MSEIIGRISYLIGKEEKNIEELKDESEGYIYCIETRILEIYNERLYILEKIKDKEEIKEVKKRYPTSIRILNKIRVPKVNQMMEILRLSLYKKRVNGIFY